MVVSQAASTVYKGDIDLGNALVYVNSSAFTSFSSAIAATSWQKIGLLNGALNINHSIEKVEFSSGTPAKLQQTYYTNERLRVDGNMLEFNPTNLSLILGGPTITRTVHASSPSPTTVATGSTASVLELASATGYAVGDELRIGDTTYQYGRIASISSDTVTLAQALPSTPTVGHAVAKVNGSTMDIGAVSAPSDVAIKVSKTLIGGYGSYDLYILKAQFDGNVTLSFLDNNPNLEGIQMPFAFDAISDPDVESGKLARYSFSQT